MYTGSKFLVLLMIIFAFDIINDKFVELYNGVWFMGGYLQY